MPDQPTGRPKPPAFSADPNVFAAAFLAGLQAFGANSSTLDHLKTNWHIFRKFIEWVESGADRVEYDAMVAREQALERKKVEQERLDREADEKRRSDALRAWNEKQAAQAASA